MVCTILDAAITIAGRIFFQGTEKPENVGKNKMLTTLILLLFSPKQF